MNRETDNRNGYLKAGQMAKKPRFYAVIHGRQTGIFNKWDDGARLAIDHYPGADHRAFRSLELAEEWYRQNTRNPHSLHSPIYHFDTGAIAEASLKVPLHTTRDSSSSKRIVVYAIIDPESEEPFYVGETMHFPRRQRAHLRTAHERTKRAAAKIAQILAKGQVPIFKAIEFCTTKEAALAAETKWIKHYVERGYTVWNRLREHREIKELHRAPKMQMDMIIGDGPFFLGHHHYPSRFDLKTKLRSYLSRVPYGRVIHPQAVEKLSLIWETTNPDFPALEFWVVQGEPFHRLQVVRADETAVDFDYAAAIDQIF